MFKLFTKKLTIYFICTFCLALLSCSDSSTAPATVPETLKDNIYGKWLVARTCKASNGYLKVGDKDFQEWKITQRNDRIIIVVNDSDGEGEWLESKDYPFLHWLASIYSQDLTTDLRYGTIIEIISINPLKGRTADLILNPGTNKWETLAIFDIEGQRQ